MAGASKPALDFLLRRATMTSRQLPVSNFIIRRGKTRLAMATQSLRGRDRYDGRVHALAAAPTRSRPPVVSPLCLGTCNPAAALRRIQPVSRRTRHYGAASGTPTNDHRANVLHRRQRAHALNHGGAID